MFLSGVHKYSKHVDSHLLVTPAIFKPGSTVFKACGFPTTNFANYGGGGCLIENLRHDRTVRREENPL